MHVRVAIIVLNWNGWRDTVECLESLFRIDYSDFCVIVLDNGSTDGSLERIQEYCRGEMAIQSRLFERSKSQRHVSVFEYTRGQAETYNQDMAGLAALKSDERMIVIQSDVNLGFAAGNNVGIRFALKALDPDYLLLLNNDTVVDRKFLTELVRAGDCDSSIGILCPKIYYYDHNGRSNVIWYAGGCLSPWREMVYYHVGDGEIDTGRHDETVDTSWCSGAAMLIRGTVAKDIPLNSDYPFGYEDVEYCMRASALGIRSVYVADSVIWHKVSSSAKSKGFRIRNIEGYFRFIKGNFPAFVYYYHLMTFFTITLLEWAIMFVFKYRSIDALRSFFAEVRRLLNASV